MEKMDRLPLASTLAVILGGGRGTRLWPLTEYRSKPAVPLGGRYRLIDIPISNCINSNIRKIFVLTQFNSASLNRHVNDTYRFDYFSRGFVEILAAEQREDCEAWFQGTADAVRRQWRHFMPYNPKYIMILSGDQLYRMDYRDLLAYHIENQADVTVSTIPVRRSEAVQFGLMNLDEEGRIVEFAEKPKDPEVLDRFRMKDVLKERFGLDPDGEYYLASMGIYIFSTGALRELLKDESRSDFGKHVIPAAVEGRGVFGYAFKGYWEDIGTIRAFFDANLMLAGKLPPFDLYDASSPIYTRPRYLPGTKLYSCRIGNSLIADGCIIEKADIDNSIIGMRSIINQNVTMREVVMMGADFYERLDDIARNRREGVPNIGIGEGSTIERAIIDKNVRIGRNVKIINKDRLSEANHEKYAIRDGIVIIKKNALIPDHTVI